MNVISMYSNRRACLDLMRAAHRARTDYLRPWLPEPIQPVAPPDDDGSLAASLTTAFLLMLERLTPKERGAYLLHEVFDQPYPDTAMALDMNDSGGKTPAALRILEGTEVLTALGRAHSWWDGLDWTITDIGGGRGAILTKDGQPVLALSFGYDNAGLVTDIFVTSNPDKLARLDPVVIK